MGPNQRNLIRIPTTRPLLFIYRLLIRPLPSPISLPLLFASEDRRQIGTVYDTRTFYTSATQRGIIRAVYRQDPNSPTSAESPPLPH